MLSFIKPRSFAYRKIRSIQTPETQVNFSTKSTFKMPLVVPGITSKDDSASKTEEWTNKLVGKKIGESSDAIVGLMRFIL